MGRQAADVGGSRVRTHRFPDEHIVGIVLLLAGLVVPAAWVGSRRLAPR